MHAIRIYGTKHCGFCRAAETLVQARKLPYEAIDVTTDMDLRMAISVKAGNYRTVPMIFVGDQFIGGYQELLALEQSGDLQRLLGV